MEQTNQVKQSINVPGTLFSLFVTFGNLKVSNKTKKVTLKEEDIKQIQFVLLDLLYASGFTLHFEPNEDGTTNCTLIPVPTEVREAVAQTLGESDGQ